MSTLGERLSAVRERRGLTQGEVARRAKSSHTTFVH